MAMVEARPVRMTSPVRLAKVLIGRGAEDGPEGDVVGTRRQDEFNAALAADVLDVLLRDDPGNVGEGISQIEEADAGLAAAAAAVTLVDERASTDVD